MKLPQMKQNGRNVRTQNSCNLALVALSIFLINCISPLARAQSPDFVPTTFSEAERERFRMFSRDRAMTTAQISPDGKHILTIIREGMDTEPVLLIFDANNLTQKPASVGGGKMQIVSAFWANDTRIIVVLRQDIDTIERLGGSTRQAFRTISVNVKGKDIVPLPRRNLDRRSKHEKFYKNLISGRIFARLASDPNHVLMRIDDDLNNIDNIYRVNVTSGARRLVMRGNENMDFTLVDRDGDVRVATTYKPASQDFVYLARAKGTHDWKEIGRVNAKGKDNLISTLFETLGFFNPDDPNELWVLSNHESNTASIYAFDVKEHKFTELLFRHPTFDASGIIRTQDKNGNSYPVGFSYNEKTEYFPFYTDPAHIALMKGVDQVLPNSINEVVSRSKDGTKIIIRSEGPQLPTTWFLLLQKDGKMAIESLGSAFPELHTKNLASLEWTSFTARDGRKIWSLITSPKGKGPFPAVVMPHGGPVARDSWGFDPWAQMLASFGYVVIQPQFRISTGFGREHLEAGFAQWGLTQQDDIDDAGAFLVQRGLAQKDNLAIFGWSYGGYAAFIGSARDPNPYKCAIAGAGVADIPLFRARIGEGNVASRAYRDTLEGIDPLSIVDSVDIPILVIHGDDDERVRIEESDKFVAQLSAEGKQHRYVILEGANHFFGTIYYRHYMEMYPEMINWLDNVCEMKK